MGLPWMRVLEAVGGLADLAGRMRRRPDEPTRALTSTDAPSGQLEARLAGVVVAALKEAFDRDRARLELERAQLEAERQRAEEALRAELRRQAAERALGQLWLIAVMAVGLWALSAALAVVLPGLRETVPRALLAFGWVLSFAALGAAFAAWRDIAAWSSEAMANAPAGVPQPVSATAAPWLLVGALALTGASLLTGL